MSATAIGVTGIIALFALVFLHVPLAFGMIVVTGIANLIYILLRVRAERWLK